ncbi:MAG: LPXTG cell wall anchor domain-containing protein [Acidimicrobiia bacterium]
MVLEAVDCDPEETSVDLPGRSVTVQIGDADVDCLFTIAHEDDDYEQYPGDDDFDFEPPFEDADDDDDPAPPAVAGENIENSDDQAGDPPVASACDPGAPAPARDIAPQAASELPRTGTGFAPAGLLTGILMILAGVDALLGARRRQTNQA